MFIPVLDLARLAEEVVCHKPSRDYYWLTRFSHIFMM